jgi:hypothetical protein
MRVAKKEKFSIHPWFNDSGSVQRRLPGLSKHTTLEVISRKMITGCYLKQEAVDGRNRLSHVYSAMFMMRISLCDFPVMPRFSSEPKRNYIK